MDKNIEVVVFNCFIRAIKSDGKYLLFRRMVNNTGVMKFLLRNNGHANKSSDNPFCSATCTADIVKTLERITNDMAKSNGKKGGSKDLDRYEHVTMTINHLLHFFMETNGIGMDKLCSLGEKIYSHSCFMLFGDTMEDIEKQEKEEIKKIKNIEQLKGKLFHNFIRDMKGGKIDRNASFDDYLREHLPDFPKTVGRVNNDDSIGHVLGREPGLNEFLNEINNNGAWESRWL